MNISAVDFIYQPKQNNALGYYSHVSVIRRGYGLVIGFTGL